MPLIVTRSTRTRQPQGAVRPAWPGITSLLYTGASRVNAATLQVPAASAGAINPGVDGIGLLNGYDDFPTPRSMAEYPSGGPVSIVAVVEHDGVSSPAFATIVSTEYAGDTVPLFLDLRDGYSLMVGSYHLGVSRVITTSISGRRQLIVAGYEGGSDWAIFLNGVAAAVGSPGARFSIPHATLSVGRALNLGRVWTGSIYMAAVVHATPSVVNAALGRNPWRLFAPIERRIWVPSAGGSTVPSITTVYADSVTTSSVDLRVTLDYA